MTAVAFDTLRFAKRLEDAGVPPIQAAATATAFAEATGDVIATKSDIAELRHEMAGMRHDLQREIAEVRRDVGLLQREVQALELRMTIKFGTMLIGAAALHATLTKLL